MKTLFPWYTLSKLWKPGGGSSENILVFVAAVACVYTNGFGKPVDPDVCLKEISAFQVTVYLEMALTQ